MCRMVGARVGSRSYDVGGHESCRRNSIQFAFRVRRKEKVVGWQADLLTDRAVAGCYLLFDDTGIEKTQTTMSHLRRWCVQRGAAVPAPSQKRKFTNGYRAPLC